MEEGEGDYNKSSAYFGYFFFYFTQGADLFTFEAIDFYDDSEQDDFLATGNTTSRSPDENDQTTASAVEAVTHGSMNITIPITISQVEPSVPTSGGLKKITSAVQPSVSAPEGLHQTAASPVSASGGFNQITSSSISAVQPSVSASGGLHQSESSTVSASGGCGSCS